MNNQKILKQAIERAVKNGYKGIPNYINVKVLFCEGIFLQDEKEEYTVYLGHKNDVIFDHEFAKAFWGEEPKHWVDEKGCGHQEDYYPLTHWQYHLQQLVLATDRLEYLEQFLLLKEDK